MSDDEGVQSGATRKKRGSYSVGRSTRTTIIRGAAQRREQAHLCFDAVHQCASALEWVGAAVGFVSSHEGFGAGL